MSEGKRRGGLKGGRGTRRHRSRPAPKWLKERQELDEMARRRCLMILSVLSGEKPVTDAIEEAGLSRQTYYQLEERALEAMVEALGPNPRPGKPADAGARVAELEGKVARLEQEKRRAERLLLLTRKVVRTGRLTMPGRGRRRSTESGKSVSGGLGEKEKTPEGVVESPSTPTKGGEGER